MVSGRVVGVVCCVAMGRVSEIGFCGWVGCDEWCVRTTHEQCVYGSASGDDVGLVKLVMILLR